MNRPDFLILGGGIVGITVARSLRRRFPAASVTLLEKEGIPGSHASGRNSGVLHAGFYYTADSLKARFCRDGNRQLRAYIKSRGLALKECGKLVVTRDESELERLDELHRRGVLNGVELEMLSAAEAAKIEPQVRTVERALWSPTTATADPAEVIQSLFRDATREGVHVEFNTRYISRTGDHIHTSTGRICPGFVVNCAGLHADTIARDFGFSQNHRILPFKGLYLYGDGSAPRLRTNIYPVPDLRNPFLGVHFTVTCDGRTKIGPTAMPALWREQYGTLERFNAREMIEIVGRNCSLLMHAGFDFRGVAASEFRKYNRRHLVRLAAELASGIHPSANKPF